VAVLKRRQNDSKVVAMINDLDEGKVLSESQMNNFIEIMVQDLIDQCGR
jgi:hypothetical protein